MKFDSLKLFKNGYYHQYSEEQIKTLYNTVFEICNRLIDIAIDENVKTINLISNDKDNEYIGRYIDFFFNIIIKNISFNCLSYNNFMKEDLTDCINILAINEFNNESISLSLIKYKQNLHDHKINNLSKLNFILKANDKNKDLIDTTNFVIGEMINDWSIKNSDR